MKFEKRPHDHYQIGSVYLREGSFIYVTSGGYLGDYGRVSNFFFWRKIKPDGSLSKRESRGYGGTHVKPVKVNVDMKIYFK